MLINVKNNFGDIVKKALKRSLELFFILFFLFYFVSFSYLTSLWIKHKSIEVTTLTSNKTSNILDKNGNSVLQLELTHNNNITYSDLPDVFINALISAEDARFFSHNGIDLQRIISSLIANISTSSLQGGSTLTQQLIKNTLLDSSKTLDRKLNEIILALKLENQLTKEDILLAYCNNIMFDGVTLGVNNAALRFFNKSISNVNLAEAALLAGIVNAPSYYNPIRNPINAKKRMDTVLNLMYRHGYINQDELEATKKVQISDLIVNSVTDDTTYPYQAYLDIVYKEVNELVNLSPYTTPLIIETYLDVNIQKEIDKLQEGKIINFSDDNQQFALALIDNETGALVASMGGRNYNGQLLFNRASDMLNQPASSIKPLLSYALGIEYLNYNSKEVLKDEEYTYSDGSIVNNVDRTYTGEILIEDAIGYSKNTTALSTLEKVIDYIGVNNVTNYLSAINLLDVSPSLFNMAYGLGAFVNGVSPYNLASAYSMIANKGVYQKGYTVKRIINASTNEILYTHKEEKTKVLSTSTSDILTDILANVVENNYYGLGSLKIKNSKLYLKTGTSSFDSKLLKELNYPSNASKDLWIAGFSKQYSFAIWSGFDYPKKGENNYFKAGSDERKTYHKQILSHILKIAIDTEGEVELSNEVTPVYLVKGTKLLPNQYIPNSMIVKAYFKKGYEPNEVIEVPSLKDINEIELLFYDNYLDITFLDYAYIDISKKENTIYSTYKVYGDIEYVIELNGVVYTSSSYNFEIELEDSFIYELVAYTRYSKVKDITSNKYYSEFNLFQDWLSNE